MKAHIYYVKKELANTNLFRERKPGTVHILSWYVPFTAWDEFKPWVINPDKSLFTYFSNLEKVKGHIKPPDFLPPKIVIWRVK